MEIREVFARYLPLSQRARGLSQLELAHQADIDRTYISSLKRVLYNASIDVADRLVKAVDISASELLARKSAACNREWLLGTEALPRSNAQLCELEANEVDAIDAGASTTASWRSRSM